MSNYNTGNPAPSTDPRDLDDNATVFDLLLQSPLASVPDRLGVQRKTWSQMEDDAAALVAPNIAALAAVTPAVDKAFYFSAIIPVTMLSYTLTGFARALGAATDKATFRAGIDAAKIGANTDITSITGSAASLTTSRTLSTTGDATWSVSFNGTSNATADITLSASGVTAGTYGSVTVNAKGLVTSASVATPIANGGTGATSAGAALTALGAAPVASPAFTGVPTAPTATVGTNTTQLATMAALQARILGIVSQSGGTPTGTIIERGSNANGAYVKYADGTMVCTFVVASVSVAVTTAYGTLFSGQPATWTFPVAFVGANPHVTMTPFASGKLAWGTRSGAPGLTTASFAVLDVISATVSYQLSYVAIGQWF